MIYDGTEAHANGDSSGDRQIGKSSFNEKYEDITYSGYTYGENFTLMEEDTTTSTITYINIDESSVYYFSNNYECTNTNDTYSCSLTGSKISGTWSSIYSSVISSYPYTCFSTSEDGTCLKIRKVTKYESSTSATIIWLGWTSNSLEDVYGDTDSIIKSYIDSWYKENILNKNDSNGTSYSNYISDEIFCGDRTTYLLNNGTSSWNNNPITYNTEYSGYRRIMKYSTYSPILSCDTVDSYTVGNSNGNGKLKYPISLITADEVWLAGGLYEVQNIDYYLYTGQKYFTLTPSVFGYQWGLTNIWKVTTTIITDGSVVGNFGVRPVINISSDVLVASGDGTKDSPYELKLSE